MVCQLETNCVALERIFEYINNQQEDEWEKPDDSTEENETWPQHGVITYENYQARYRFVISNHLVTSNILSFSFNI